MNYKVIFSLEAVEDVLRVTSESSTKAAVIAASQQIQEALASDPTHVGTHLSEGLYYLDCDPLRAFFVVDEEERDVEIVNVRAQ